MASRVLTRSLLGTACLSLVFLVVGCVSGESFKQDPTQSASSEIELTDAEIAHVAMELNRGEVLTSKPAVDQASNSQVRHFAEQMVAQHSRAVQRLEQELAKSDIEAERNQISSATEANAQRLAEAMKNEQGQNFDRSYLEAQVSQHEAALNMLDENLIPKAEDDRLKQYLTQMRVMVSQHLETATRMLRTGT